MSDLLIGSMKTGPLLDVDWTWIIIVPRKMVENKIVLVIMNELMEVTVV